MVKQFKVTLKFKPNARRYQVAQIVGPRAVVVVQECDRIEGTKIRVGDMLTEGMTELLGERAVLKTQ